MTAKNAGSAFIRIKPDARDFVRDLRRDLAATKDPGFVVDVTANTAQARADIARFREVENRKGMRLGVDVALGQADADMKAFRARQHANGLTIKVDADTGKARAELAAFRRQAAGIGDLGSSLRFTLGAAGIAGLPAAAAGLAQVAGAIQQVAQAGLLLPGLFAGATASIGTLVAGLSGVPDAYKAVSQAAQSSASDGVAASNRLRNAVVDETQARRDQAQAYRDARNQLQDLNVEMRGGLLDESRALLEAQKAREDLARGNYTDRRDAQLRVLEMDQRVLEVRTRNAEKAEKLADVNAKGIANSDQVVAANERVVRAQQAVAEASEGQASAAQKAADAMAKLSPNARQFVNSLIGLKPVVGELRTSIQDIGFDGLGSKLVETVRTLMPTLQDGLGGIARGWNENFKQLFTSIGSDESKGLLDRILGNTAEAQSRFSAAIDPLVHGIGTLSAAGTDALPRLAAAIGSVANRFDEFITAADKDGRLQKWIDEGMTAFGHLGETVLNLGKSWAAITKAAGGGALLSTLETLTGKLQTFLNSTEGQNKMREFFEQGRDMFEQWKPVLEAIPGLFKGIYDGSKTYIGGVLEVIGPLVKFLSDHPTLVATAVGAWGAWKAIGPIVSGVQNTLGAFSGALTNLGTGFTPIRDKAKAAMDEVDTIFANAGKKDSGVGKFAAATAWLSAAGGPLAMLVTAGLPLIAQFAAGLKSDMDDAANHVKAVDQAAQGLIGTLERVTNLTGLGTRNEIAKQLQSRQTQGTPDKGLGGDALAALTALGIGGPGGYDAVTATLPGGEQQYDKIMGQLRDKVRPTVQDFIRNQGIDMQAASGRGIDENTIIDAWLGVPAALDKLRDWKQLGQNVVDLGTLYRQVNGLGADNPTYQASLGGQRMNFERSAAGGAVQQAQAAQSAAAPVARLKPEFTGQFPNAVVNTDGNNTTIVSTIPPDGMKLDPNTKVEQGVPPNQDKWTYRLSPEDARKYTYAKGGPTPTGLGPLPGGGYPAVVHPDEFMISKRGRATVPDSFLHALNQGLVDPKVLPKFDGGGLVDPYGNPTTPGPVPGVGPVAAPIAPNPTDTGGVAGIFGKVLSGIQGPIGNALSLGTSLVNSGMAGGGADAGLAGMAGADPVQGFAANASQVPGLIGLFGSMAISDPGAQASALTSWGAQTLGWTANWATNTLSQASSILWDGGNGAGGVLGFLGLGNSVLSGSNPWNQAASQTASFMLGSGGPLSTMLGGNGSQGPGGSITDPASLAAQYGVTIDPTTGQLTTGAMASDSILSPNFLNNLQSMIAASGTHAAPGNGESARDFAHRVMMPYWQNKGFTVGDHGADKYGEHQNGAIDIMVPDIAAGNSVLQQVLKDPNVYGAIFNNQVYGYGQGMSPRDYTSGHTGDPNQDHLNHVHVWYKPTSMDSGGPTPSSFGPMDAKGGHLAVVHPDEFMISKRGRATVPDSFLHALNQGIVDPRELPKYAVGGPVMAPPPTGYVPPNPNLPIPTPPAPKPNFSPGAGAQTKIVPTPAQAAPAPAPARPATPTMPVAPPPQTVPSTPPPSTTAPTPYTAPQITAPTMGAPAPDSINHNLPAVSKGISSAASAIGQAISTAIGLAAGGAGAAGVPGAGAIGAIGPYAAGLVNQGGKVVDAAVNVISSALVGNVPGSQGDPFAPPGGQTLRPDQNRPVTADYRGGGNTTYNISGHDTREVLQMARNEDNLQRQARLAAVPVR